MNRASIQSGKTYSTAIVTVLLLVLALAGIAYLSSDKQGPAGSGASALAPPTIPTAQPAPARPNFLLILSDDQSWLHTSLENYPLVQTPNFDRIANEGVYFRHAYAAAPTCTASRSAILAGQPIWRLGSSALLVSEYSPQMISYQLLLAEAGYNVGFTGKGWEPGSVPRQLGLPFPPTGVAFNAIAQDRGSHLGSIDLAANFEQFLDQLPDGQPFSFWVGSIEPHRSFAPVANRFGAADHHLIPGFLPNTARMQDELSSYLDEIEIFDADIGKLLALLEERKLLENTVVIVTSDNGMDFPRAKSNNYEYGVRVPLAVRWGAIAEPGRRVDDLANLADIAPTLLELAGMAIPDAMTANSFAPALLTPHEGMINTERDATVTAFERHGGYIRGGEQNLTYPRRAIHTAQFAYIRNYFPERWPAGDPPKFHEAHPYLLRDAATQEPLQPFFDLATARRPAEELYDLQADPDQLTNLAQQEEYLATRLQLAARLGAELRRTDDPLELTGKDTFTAFKYLTPYQP